MTLYESFALAVRYCDQREPASWSFADMIRWLYEEGYTIESRYINKDHEDQKKKHGV